MIRAVVCDLFGTLVAGSTPQPREAVAREMATLLGVDGPALAAAVRRTYDLRMRGRLGDLEATVDALARELGGDPSPEAVARAGELRVEMTRGFMSPLPGTLEALGALRAAGLRLALCSDCSAETPLVWSGSVLAEHFEAAAFSCDVGLRKPAPAMYRAAFAGLGLPPRECAFVGDGGSRELTGAAGLGMRAFLLDGGGDSGRNDPDLTWSGETVGALAELVERVR